MNTTISFDYIVDVICRGFELNVDDVLAGKGRKQEITTCRHLIAYFSRKYVHSKTFTNRPMPLKDIGKRMNKDHASIIHANKNVINFMKYNAKFRDMVNHYDTIINAKHYIPRCAYCGSMTSFK